MWIPDLKRAARRARYPTNSRACWRASILREEPRTVEHAPPPVMLDPRDFLPQLEPTGVIKASKLAEQLETSSKRLRRPDLALDALERELLKDGPGASATFRGTRLTSRGASVPGHAFNAVSCRGKVYFLDGQTDGAADLSGFAAISYARTN